MPKQGQKSSDWFEKHAATIVEEHKAGLAAEREALQHYVKAGQALVSVKEQLPHGEFGPWIKSNCRISSRRVRHYMQLAKTEVPTTDLEATWRKISGNAKPKKKGKFGTKKMAEHPPKQRSIEFSKREWSEVKDLIRFFLERSKAESNQAAIIAALRFWKEKGDGQANSPRRLAS